MSPTIFRERGYRFYFFAREETRPHVHVYSTDGEAKQWLEPNLELARNHKLSTVKLKEIERIVEDYYDELITAWNHFLRSGDN